MVRRLLAVIPVMLVVATVVLRPHPPGPRRSRERDRGAVRLRRGHRPAAAGAGSGSAPARAAREVVRPARARRPRGLDLPPPAGARGDLRASGAHPAPHRLGHADRGAHRRARGGRLGAPPQLLSRPVLHGARPGGPLGTEFSPGAPHDSFLRRMAGLAPRRRLCPARGWALAQPPLAHHARAGARAGPVRADRPHHPLEHAGRAARAVHPLRSRRRASPSAPSSTSTP